MLRLRLAVALSVLLLACAPPGAPSLVSAWWAQLHGWLVEHPLEALGLALYLLINVANRLASYPRASGVRAVLLVVIDWLSFLPHRDSPGLFTVPLVGRSTPPEDAEHMSLSRAAAG